MAISETPHNESSHRNGAANKAAWLTPAQESQALGNSVDSIATPRSHPNDPLAVVGLGASAGGIQVLGSILEGISPDSGLAFVVVMHLSPDHESNLAQVLQARTKLPVAQVTEAVRVEANHVYVIPPAQHIVMRDGSLHLAAPQQQAGKRVAIDLFFRTLATAYGQRAVCAVLSGTDSDGVIGLKHIKEQGGVTIAQEPDEAEYDSMPRAAVQTGMVDWVLPAAGIASRLLDFARNEQKMHVPPEDAPEAALEAAPAQNGTQEGPRNGEPAALQGGTPGGPLSARQVSSSRDESALSQVLALLRAATGHDFAHYKRATVLRRIARRMQVNVLEDIPAYLEFLHVHAPEAQALLQDLLINVTNFFRDPMAFAALQSHIPQLFTGKSADDQVRVWVCGCASGEEAYSVAMLLLEHAARLDAPPSIQVFATDIDDEVIALARAGSYPMTIEADVSTERLRRFFTIEQGRYRIRQEVRERVLFASHDVLGDSPFSRLDLVTCRNLLIYLKREAQERVFDIFHFALRSGGLMFLGGSESVDDSHMLFAPLDKKHRIFVRRAMARPSWQVPMPLAAPSNISRARIGASASDGASATASTWESPMEPSAPLAPVQSLLPADLHLRLLERYAPPSVVVNANHDIVHLSEHAGRFLQLAGGEPTLNLLKVVHPALRIELRTALFRAAQSQSDVSARRVPIELEGSARLIDIHVRPEPSSQDQSVSLVVFEDVTAALSQAVEAGQAPPQVLATPDPDSTLVHLEQECHQLKAQLASTVEQYEGSVEELKASNEELQAMNEEMRSATEELQTSKEELQSVNEELTTVNHELKSSLDEMARLNSDLQNLLTSTEIGTVFLDRQGCIKRFTPRVQELFNVIPTDVGRPLSDLTHKFNAETFGQDAERVLRDLTLIEREVQNHDGQTFLARLLPYRTTDDRIDGIVLTFVDITARRQKEDEVRELAQRLAQQARLFDTTLTSVSDFIYIFNHDGRFIYSNRPLLDLLGITSEEIAGKNFFDLNYPPDLAARLQRQIQEVVETGQAVRDETPFTSVAGEPGFYEYIFSPVFAEDGRTVEAVAGSTRDVSERKRIEIESRLNRERLQKAMEAGQICSWEMNPATRQIEWSGNTQSVVGFRLPESLDQTLRLIHAEDREPTAEAIKHAIATGEHYESGFRLVNPANGEVLWFYSQGAVTTHTGDGQPRFTGITQNITERKRAEQNAIFLGDISQMLLDSSTEDEIMRAVGERIGAHFGLSSCAFADIDDAQKLAIVTQDWHRTDVSGLVGSYQREDLLSDEFQLASRAGETFVVRDTESDPRTQAERYRAIDVRAFVSVPVVREGEWVFLLALHDSKAREWREDEIELMRELTARIWVSLERRRAEQALRASEERFRALVTASSDALYGMSADWSELRLLHGGTFIAGPPEPNGQWMGQLIHPDDQARGRAAIEQAIRTKSVFELEHRVRRADGSRGWTFSRAVPLLDARGEIVEWFGAASDITARRQAEEALRESERLFRTLSDTVPQIIWTNESGGRATYFNSRWFEYSGLSLEDSLGPGWQAIVHPEDALASVERWQKALERGETFDCEYRLRRADGIYRWHIGRNVPLRDSAGQVVSWFGSATDIEELKGTERALRESEERFRLLVEGTRDYAMFLMDAQRRIIHWNSGAERIFGYARDQVLGQSGDIIFTPEDREADVPQQEAQQAAEQGHVLDVRWHVRQDGSRFWVDGIMTSLRDECGQPRGFVKIIRDATKERQAEEALRQAHNELEVRVQQRTSQLQAEVTQRRALERDRARLLRGIVTAQEDERRRLSRELHDQMGQTLTALMLGLKLLPIAEDPGLSQPTPADRLRSLQTLTGELVDYAHHLAWELRPAVLDNIGLEAALSQYVHDWSQRVGVSADFIAHGVKGKRRLPTDVESTFYRVTQEALSNVARHAQASQVSVLLESRGEEVIVVIEDNGQGFDPEQVSNRLGLVGIRERLELVGGALTIESALGEGTVVYARVPIRAAGEAANS